MNLYLSMSIAGTIPLAVYFLLKLWQGENSSLRWRMRLLKLSMFFYLCPFQRLKYILPISLPDFFYRNIFRSVNRHYLKREGYLTVPDLSGEYALLPTVLVVFAFLWLLAVIGFVFFVIVQYIHMLQNLRKASFPISEPIYTPHIKRKISFRTCPGLDSPYTIGILKPCIVLPDQKFAPDILQMILLHEETHVRHWDILHNLICFIICLLYCFNPAVWLLLHEYNIVSEQLCDEQVVKAFSSRKSRKTYALLLVAMSGKQKNFPSKSRNLKSKGENHMKKRINTILNMKKRKAGIVPLLFSLSIFASSLTAFAYQEYSISNNMIELVDKDNKEFYFYDKDEYLKKIMVLSFSDSNAIFIPDGGGQILDIPDSNPISITKVCVHTYEIGTKYSHTTNSSGGCTIKECRAKTCKKCGHCIVLEEIAHYVYKKCPHRTH